MNITIKAEDRNISYAAVILEIGDYIGLHSIIQSKYEHKHLNGSNISYYTKRK